MLPIQWKVSFYAHPITHDIDPTASLYLKVVDGLLNRCVGKAMHVLKQKLPNYSDFHQSNIIEIFRAMQHTHESVRTLLSYEHRAPMSVDAIPLARLQLEALYAICLMFQDPEYVLLYLKDAWKKMYVRFLLEREECRTLPRYADFLTKEAPALLKGLQALAGVSDDERSTIDFQELGTPLPPGATRKDIQQFPTPRKVIGRISDEERKRMLLRLYPEYQHLSSFVHGSAEAVTYKTLFNQRSGYPTGTTSQQEAAFQRRVAGPAVTIDYLSILQCATELITLYPEDIDLRATLVDAWDPMINQNLLGNVIWEIRSKKLLGSM